MSVDRVPTNGTDAPVPVPAASGTDATPAQHVEAIAMAHVRLPSFWRNSASQWFAHAEAVFHNARTRSNIVRVNHVLAALDEDGVRSVADLLGQDVTYEALKARLIATHTVPPATRFQAIAQPGGMGDRTPSVLLRDMRDAYPGGSNDDALEQFWRQKLPAVVRIGIAGLSGSLNDLAERADRIWEASQASELSEVGTRPTRVRVAAVFPATPATTVDRVSDQPAAFVAQHAPVASDSDARIAALENTVLALTTRLATLQLQQMSSSTPSREARTRPLPKWVTPKPLARSRDTSGWCFYHQRYDEAAQKCRAPCTFNATQKN